MAINRRGHCLNKQACVFLSAAVNIASDLTIFLMPLTIVLPLWIRQTRKLGACAVLLIGIFAVCSIIRRPCLVYQGNSQNLTCDNAELATWSSIEANWAIVCVCVCVSSFARPIKAAWVGAGHAITHRSAAIGTILSEKTERGLPRPKLRSIRKYRKDAGTPSQHPHTMTCSSCASPRRDELRRASDVGRVTAMCEHRANGGPCMRNSENASSAETSTPRWIAEQGQEAAQPPNRPHPITNRNRSRAAAARL